MILGIHTILQLPYILHTVFMVACMHTHTLCTCTVATSRLHSQCGIKDANSSCSAGDHCSL